MAIINWLMRLINHHHRIFFRFFFSLSHICNDHTHTPIAHNHHFEILKKVFSSPTLNILMIGHIWNVNISVCVLIIMVWPWWWWWSVNISLLVSNNNEFSINLWVLAVCVCVCVNGYKWIIGSFFKLCACNEIDSIQWKH